MGAQAISAQAILAQRFKIVPAEPRLLHCTIMVQYIPDGPPGKHYTNLWINAKEGDNYTRCWGAILAEKGHDVTMVETTKSNENPVSAWAKVVIEEPSKSGGKSSSETKKKKKG